MPRLLVTSRRRPAVSLAMKKAMPGSTARGMAFHFDAIAQPSAMPVVISLRRPVSGSRIAPANCQAAIAMNAAMKISSMAMRLCTNSMNPVAISTPKDSAEKREGLANHIARMLANKVMPPAISGKMRQPNGSSPKIAMPKAMISLPSNGCSRLMYKPLASSSRAAGR